MTIYHVHMSAVATVEHEITIEAASALEAVERAQEEMLKRPDSCEPVSFLGEPTIIRMTIAAAT